MKVVPVPVREDNYAYLLIDESTNKAAAIDPFDVSKVSAAADVHGVKIIAGITTHHHFDHSGGNKVCNFQPLSPCPLILKQFRNLFVISPNLVYTTYFHILQASKYPNVTIYGGSDKIPAVTKLLLDKDEFYIGDHIHVR